MAILRSLLAGLLVALVLVSRAEAGQFVQFESGKTLITGYLAKPGIGGRHPAVVLLHGSGGFHATMISWADRLSHWGYVALAVDSFGSRGVEVGTGSNEQPKDAYAALHYLSELSFVRADSVALMGFSLGGSATLVIAALDRGSIAPAEKFRAAVAFYPDCSGGSAAMTMPTLILVGELDDWTPAGNCRALAANRSNVELVVLPNARHAFDVLDLSEVPGGISVVGHRLEYNAEAAKDAQAKLRAFLKRTISD